MKKYNLREKRHAQHQTYALGIKEVTVFIISRSLTYQITNIHYSL